MEGITKTFTLTGTKGTSARVTVTEQYDIAANASVLTVAVAVSSSNYYGHTYYLTGSITAAGQTLAAMKSSSGNHSVTISKKNTYYGVKGSPWETDPLTHNNDGSLTVTVAVDFKGYEPSGKGANGFSISGSRAVTLTQIPRASTLGATDAAIGSVSLIAVSRKSAEYAHSLSYSFGSRGGYLTEGGAISDTEVKFTETAIPFALPEDFYYEIPDAPSGKCTLTCVTYLGDDPVGEAQVCQFTVTADPALCAPLVTGSVRDGNPKTVALTGDDTVLVRYASQARCSLTAEARFGATLAETTVCGAVLEDDLTLPPQDSYQFAALDSRGYQGTHTVTPTLIPYVILTCRAAAKRDDPTSGRATLTVSGECYNGTFGGADNSLTLLCRVGEGEWLPLTPVFQEHTYTAAATLTGLDYNLRHTVTVAAADLLSDAQAFATVDKGIPVFDWGEEDFQFHVPVLDMAGEPFPRKGECVPPSRTVCGYPLTDDVTLTPADIGALPFTESPLYPGCFCRETEEQTEWLNPPMEPGTEYRTAARHRGQPVYTLRLEVAGLPNDGTANIPLELPAANMIRCQNVIRTDQGYLVQSPYFTAGGSLLIKHLFTGSNLQITTSSDYRGATAQFDISYVKEAAYA